MIKKTFCLIVALGMVISFSACKKSNTSSDSSTYSSSEAENSDGSASAQGSETQNSSEASNTSGKSESASSGKTVSRATSGNVNGGLSGVPKSLKGTTLTIYSWNVLNDVPGANNLIKTFQSKTGIKVKWLVGSYDNYQSEIAAMVAAKNSPDIIRMRGVVPGTLSLMDPITVSGYDFKDSAWDSFVSQTYTFNGKTYAVNLKNTLLQQPLTMFYNTELIAKYDLSDPYTIWMKNKSDWNWNKFIEICRQYKSAAGSDSTPWTLNLYTDYAMTYGASVIKRDGDKFVSGMGDSTLLKGFQKMAEFKSEKLWSDRWDMNGFNTGKYLFFGPAIISARKAQFQLTDLKAKGALGVVPYPCVPGQSTYYQNIFEVEAYGIPKGAKNAEAVPYFLRYYLDADNYNENQFFNDKKILNVYKYCMTKTTLVPEYSRHLMLYSSCSDEYTKLNTQLLSASPNQIQSILNSYEPVVQRALKEQNQAISALK